jgi:hypothetical protein
LSLSPVVVLFLDWHFEEVATTTRTKIGDLIVVGKNDSAAVEVGMVLGAGERMLA